MTTKLETPPAGVNPTAPDGEPDEQQYLADQLGPGIDSVTITGPDGTTGAAAIAKAIDNAHLFDAAPYVEAIDIDGQSADKLKVSFAGSIEYDPTDPSSRALFESLTLGKPVELRVAGYIAKKNGSYGENSEGETTVTGTAGIKVTTLYLLTPEDLT